MFCFSFSGLFRHRCLLCRLLGRSPSIDLPTSPLQVVTILPISLLMKEPGIMMLFYDIPMLVSCPTSFLPSFLSLLLSWILSRFDVTASTLYTITYNGWLNRMT